MTLENAKKRYKHYVDSGQTERAKEYLGQLGKRHPSLTENTAEEKKDAKKPKRQ